MRNVVVTAAPMRRPKLAVLVTHPIQYYAPLYRCLAQRGAVDVVVVYLSDAGAVAYDDPGFSRQVQWDVPLLEGYDYKVLQPSTSIASRGFWRTHDSRLLAMLDKLRPDWLLVYGYASRMNWAAVRWARSRKIKVAYTSDSNSRNPERWPPVKKFVIGHFFRQVDAFLATSERNVEYLLKYRADKSRIRRIPFAIDVARFAAAETDAENRRQYDFVWAGKFTLRKRGGDFIKALDILAQRSDRPVKACMAGDGPCREDLVALARRLPNHCDLDFLGFVNQNAMPSLLRSTQIFAFTSEIEPYGLMATEAAAAGLALIVADDSGCVGPTVLARPGVNALTYRAGDMEGLAQAMQALLHDTELLQRMQRASLEVARQHDMIHAADVIERLMNGEAES